MFDFHKLINVINCLDKLKNKNHMIISTNAGKVLTKFNMFIIKIFSTKWVYKEHISA